MGKMLAASTGGTTGTSVKIFVDPVSLQEAYAIFHEYQWRWAGVEFGEPWVMISGRKVVPLEQKRPPFWRYNAASKQHFFSCFHIREDTIPVYLEKMAQIDAPLLHLYPSTASAFATYMKRHGRTGMVKPRAIISTSETLFPETRALIEEQFQTRVFNHYKGDAAVQICQCEHGGLHVPPLFGYVEFHPIAGSDVPGGCEMVVTGLSNRGTVLIRHRIGDVAVPGDRPCPCGRTLPTVKTLLGRTGDVVVTPDGYQVNASNLTDVFKDTPHIRRGQFVQDAEDHLLARLEVWPGFDGTDERRFRDEVRARIGTRMRLDVEVVDEIELTVSGKFRFVINELS
jgi:phenylacetate-CoA ligase